MLRISLTTSLMTNYLIPIGIRISLDFGNAGKRKLSVFVYFFIYLKLQDT